MFGSIHNFSGGFFRVMMIWMIYLRPRQILNVRQVFVFASILDYIQE